jgi:hypothetical protein
MMGGEQVHFSADFIFTRREYSEMAINLAIYGVSVEYPSNFRDYVAKHGIVTIEDYNTGNLWNRMVIEGGSFTECGMQAMINKNLAKRSFCETCDSKTAGAVFFTHDDGYSRFGSVAA